MAIINTYVPTAVSQKQVHYGIWFYVLMQYFVAGVFSLPVNEWWHALLAVNLIEFLAFIAIFHILNTNQDNNAPASANDFVLFALVICFLSLSSLFGVSFDLGVISGFLGAQYLILRPLKCIDDYFLGAIYLSMGFNQFIAPLIFQLFKPIFLMWETQFAVLVNGFLGYPVHAEGLKIVAEDGIRLRLVGACSVFSNLSYAILGFVALKGICRSQILRTDVIYIGIIAFSLIIANTLRFGLMTPSVSAYEYWHHGFGASIFGFQQLIFIAVPTVISILVFKYGKADYGRT